MFRFIAFIFKKNPGRALLACALDAGAVIFSAGLYGVAAFLIAMSALRPSFEVLMLPVVEVRFFGLGRAALRYCERLVSHDTTFRVLRDLRVYIYDRLEPRLPGADRLSRRGAVVSRVISDVENMQDAFLRVLYPFMVSILVFIVGIFITLVFDPLFTLIFAMLYIPVAFVFPVLIGFATRDTRDKAAKAKQQLYNEFTEFSDGLQEIIANSRGEDWEAKLEATLRLNYEAEKRNNTQSAVANALSVLFQGISLSSLLVAGCWLGANGKLPGEIIAALPLAANALFEASLPCFSAYTRFEKTASSAGRIFDMTDDEDKKNEGMDKESGIDMKPAGESAGVPGEKPVLPTAAERLCMKDVCFSYQNEREVLNKFSLELSKGQMKAMIGASGTGKSTVLNLLTGFIKDYSGEITVDGVDIRSLTHERLLCCFSVVDQNPYFFNDTIRENLKVANPGASEEDMIEALEKAHLYDGIKMSPKGLDTMVQEWGRSLSGGELQRLAIARGLLKNAPFYLFDEPTAGLDTINERKIMELMKELSRDKGVLLVTHRLVMLDRMDEVVEIC